ncbi:unnamed protein product [Clonostachys solani]|uniref:Uncharacterized protein n=1 Tax=Clonostachys solani TaxID=160281 RepID=A0A9N9ZEG2_9HYPO|nr:unnamed protein product [Clonostachys solani]
MVRTFPQFSAKEISDNILMALVSCSFQNRSQVTGDMNVSAILYQQLNNLTMPIICRKIERISEELVVAIHIRAFGKEAPGSQYVSVARGKLQRAILPFKFMTSSRRQE